MRGFKVELLDAVAAQHDHPGFFRMGRVDKHFVGHWTVSLRRVGSQPPPCGSANRDGPDLSVEGRVTEPRQGAVRVRRQARALDCGLRCGRTLKNASGMTSTRWRAAAHRATGLVPT